MTAVTDAPALQVFLSAYIAISSASAHYTAMPISEHSSVGLTLSYGHPSCSVLKYQDWVWSVVARGGMLLVANGPEVHVHDLPTGKLLRKVSDDRVHTA